jgi:hypothetical protein
MQAVNERLFKNSRKDPFKTKRKSLVDGSVHMSRWMEDKAVITYRE